MKPRRSWRRLGGLFIAAALPLASSNFYARPVDAADLPAVSRNEVATKLTTACDDCVAIISVDATNGAIAIDHGLDTDLPAKNRELLENAVGGFGKAVYMCLKSTEADPYSITLAPDGRSVGDLSTSAPCFELPPAHLGYQQVKIDHTDIKTKKAWTNVLVLPTGGVDHYPPQLLWLDAATNRATEEQGIRPLDGETMRVWAFNVKVLPKVAGDPSPQTFAFVKGPPIAASPLGPLIAYGVSGLGTTIGLTPTPPSPTAANGNTSGAGTGGPTSVTVQCFSGTTCPTVTTPGAGACTPAASPYSGTWTYGSGINLTSVTGGFHYIAQVSDSSVSDQTHLPGKAPDQTRPVVASESIEAFEPHRKVSVGIEEAWNWSRPWNYGSSGYGYVPVAQTGPDQIYQLQSLNRVADEMTFSVLGLVYPCRAFFSSWYRCTGGAGGWVIGLGPTLMRGSSSEIFRQWNSRVGYEVVDHVIVGLGLSWRSIDTPTSGVGSLLSVPKPASPPAFSTMPDWNYALSIGVTVDLDVITEGIASVSGAVSSGAKTPGK